MNINLANIDFCPGEGGGTPSEVKLAPTTAEILLTETEKVILPPEGTDGFNKVTITHAPVEESVNANITSNGTHTITPSEGFGAMFGVSVDVNVPSKPEVAKDITITQNGNTTYTPNEGEVFNRVSVDVNVPTIDDTLQYFYRKPTADDAGLKAIGWTDDDVNYFKYNNYAYPWEADNYKLWRANKEIVINNEKDVAKHKDDAAFQYCPMFENGYMTGMNNVFKDCKYLISIPKIDVSNVTSMRFMFQNCLSLTIIPPLDTSKVTNMYYMFYDCLSLTSIPQLDTSNVTNMQYMFNGCSSLTSIPQLNTSKVTSMSNMLAYCQNLTSVPRLDATSLTSANNMFGNSYRSLLFFTTFGGLTGLKVDLDLSMCPKLTHESLLNVVNELADVTASPKTLTLGEDNLNKLWNEEKAIATNKGWTLA